MLTKMGYSQNSKHLHCPV